jgi:hypothetical protein
MSSIAGRRTGESGAQWRTLPMFCFTGTARIERCGHPHPTVRKIDTSAKAFSSPPSGGGDALDRSPQPHRALHHAFALRATLPRAVWQGREQRPQMPCVAAPAPDRMPIERLAHLPGAGGQDRPLRAMKVETGRFPFEAEKLD